MKPLQSVCNRKQPRIGSFPLTYQKYLTLSYNISYISKNALRLATLWYFLQNTQCFVKKRLESQKVLVWNIFNIKYKTLLLVATHLKTILWMSHIVCFAKVNTFGSNTFGTKFPHWFDGAGVFWTIETLAVHSNKRKACWTLFQHQSASIWIQY